MNDFSLSLNLRWICLSSTGNDHLYDIVSQGRYELRIDMEDFDGNKRYAAYDIFKIGSASEKYKLMVGQYSGDAGR